MLDVHLEDDEDDTTFSIIILVIIPTENKINCDICDQEAFIFQEEGNFCLSCWQNRTEPSIS